MNNAPHDNAGNRRSFERIALVVAFVGDGCRNGPQTVQRNEEVGVHNDAAESVGVVADEGADEFGLADPDSPVVDQADRVVDPVTNVHDGQVDNVDVERSADRRMPEEEIHDKGVKQQEHEFADGTVNRPEVPVGSRMTGHISEICDVH